MKIQIDLEKDIWIKFREKVQGDGKTLREVVPTLFEPALREYLDPPPEPKSISEEIEDKVQALSEDINKKIGVPPPIPTVKRCELCDTPTERRFNFKGQKVCYTCWRDGIINEAVPAPPVSNISRSEVPSPSSVSSPS